MTWILRFLKGFWEGVSGMYEDFRDRPEEAGEFLFIAIVFAVVITAVVLFLRLF